MTGYLATLSTMVISSSVVPSAGGPAGSVASGRPATSPLFFCTRGSREESRIVRRGLTEELTGRAPKTSGSVVRVSVSIVGVVARRVWGRPPGGKVGEGRAVSREKVVV